MVHVLLLAHGSRDPRHAATMEAIATAVQGRWAGAAVGVAYLDLGAPNLERAVQAGSTDDPVVVVPMLLTDAFHASVDVPAAVASARAANPGRVILVAAPLGPSDLLRAALERRLVETGNDPSDPDVGVVLLAAGSSVDAARAQVAAVADAWLEPPRRGTHAFASGPGPNTVDAVSTLASSGAARIVLVPYFLAPGVLLDRAVALAATATVDLAVDLVVADVLGAAEEVLDLIAERARAAGS